MQSFREQSNYHGSQQTYPPEAHGTSRIEEYSPRQQAQMFQGSYGGRRGATGTPTTVTPGENSSLQSYPAYRKESGDFYYLGNKEGSAAGSQTPQRRPSGPVQNYGPPQGSNSSGSTGFGAHYGREGHHSQFSSQHSATANISQYSQDFPGSFSPSGGQYPSHVPTQQLRQQLYQSHHPISSQSANTSASTGASHLQQMQRSAAISSSVGYPLRMGQYGQHYQSSAGSSTSYPPQRFGQSGANYEGYSPGGTNSPYESHISGSSYGTQQGFSSYSQHLKNFESTKIAQGGNQGQPQQNPHVMQFSNTSKLITQSQTGPFNQSEVPVRSPMQFQQNFSPISNPSPAASVVQSPSCSSTPSPLMTSGENLQCSQGNVQHPSRNRILPMMPQLSPNTPIGSYKSFGVEGQPDKRLTDPGLSSLSALSSQVANLPNTVQHMLLSDALAPNKKGSKRTSRKTDSCANSETSSQAEEQLKSPMTESLDGSCSSSSGDPGERVRQLSGQSTSSEAGYKGPPSEKPASPVQGWQNEPLEKLADQDPDTVSEPVESFQEVPKPSEKSVGVIVSMETMTNRLEKVVDEVSKPVDDLPVESNLPKTEEKDDSCSNNQNGESSACDSVSAATTNVSQTESVRSPGSGFGIKEASTSTKFATNLPQNTKNVDSANFGAQGDRKPGRNEKIPSLLQEVLQGHHQQEGRYARSTQEHPAGMGNSEIVLRSNVLTSQANEQSNRNILGKNAAPHLEAPHWGQWERKSTLEAKPKNLDFPTARKFEAEVSTSSHESSSGPSERRSVICDISPLRQIVREPSGSHLLGTAQERPPDGRPGLSVILPSGMLALEKTNCLGGIAKGDDVETPKMHRKQTGEHCMLYSTKDSIRGSASPRSMTYDPNQDYNSHNSRASNPKRGTGRVGSRGRSPAQTHDLSDKLKMSPGRSRGPTEIPHMNPTVSLSERASREALYSAFFQNTDSSTLGYHTNSRASSYGEPHPAFTSPLHYKRQMYQQEEYKEWLGSSAQAILSASQHRQEMQRKSPRQEPFHVRSPGRNESEGLGYNQSSSYHKPSKIDYSRQLRMSEGTSSNMINVEMKRNSQKTPSGDSTSWHLVHQASPAKKVGSPVTTNQKPFSPKRESDPHISRSVESTELPQQGCCVHRPTGSEEASHHNPLIMRRRVRSFISPIPSKRQFPDDKVRSSALKDGADKIPSAHVVSPMDANTVFSAMTEESTKSISEERSHTAVSLSSPTKTKILPPRKGRGLKLEAIVQKITSPNIRRITTPCTSESSTEPVTLDDILSLKGKGPDGGSGSMQEVTERKVNVLPSNSCNDEMKVKGLSPKSIDVWTIHDDKQIKKEMDEHSFENKELPQSSSIMQSSSNHFINARGDSPAFEPKCPLQQVQPLELGDKDKLAGGPCPVTPKQDVSIPPKGYFPSGKKKGRPVGSVNKQKKQLQHQAQQLEEQQPALPTITGGLTSPLPVPPPPEMLPISEHGLESELKPKRRRRERRKAARRRGRQTTPIVAPLEPEIKLKYASQTIDKTETKAKSFFPYIHVENKEELGLSCVIINAEDEEQRWKKLTSVRKGQRSTSQPTESKALPVSSFMVQGPVVTESSSVGHLVCCFCGKWANYKNLGDVFGPFYTQEYASTLSKNPPPKKSIETPKKVKVRHKDASDGSKTDSDEEDEPQQAREQRSLPAHPRFKRRNRSGDCASSRHAVPSRRKTTDSCELNSLDSSGTSTADGVSDQSFQIPQLPLDSNEFWMHEGCVLWANGVYLVCGRLYGLQEALDIAREMNCAHCQEPGATLGCYNKGCACCYHFPCAMDSECLLSEENFSVRCPKHKMKTLKGLSAEQPEQS
ncbi:PREDICTED: transcription factor 20 [Nanorana parkeri]|uniref:transcription factor 20 n=1 Tax=Nanorana parkeri TaxID=125878 RepID=UPI0008544588|nr:PREDICTED: transcription factor 20 [Nanorana parkeri]